MKSLGTLCLLWVWLQVGINIVATAQTRADTVTQLLGELGALDVRVLEREGHLLIGLQQGRYRFAPRGIAEVQRVLKEKGYDQVDTVSMVLYTRSLPLLTLQSFNGGPLKGHWERGKLSGLLRHKAPFRPATGRLEVTISPGLSYQLGDFNFPWRFALSAQVNAEYLFRPGLSLQGGVGLPIANNLFERLNTRIERAALVYDHTIPGRAYLSVGAGVFSLNRGGIHFGGRLWAPDERFTLRLDAGLTGNTNILRRTAIGEWGDKFVPLLIGAMEYRWRRYEVNVRLSAGRFLYQDDGVVLEVFRQIGEYRVGFLATSTTIGRNVGFLFSLPLAPRRYSMPGRVRVRVAEQFPLAYRYTGLILDGRRYIPGSLLSDQLSAFYPQYFIREMRKY